MLSPIQAWGLAIIVAGIATGLVAWGANQLTNPLILPIKVVGVDGEVRYLDRKQLEETVYQAIDGSFISVDLLKIRNELEAEHIRSQAELTEVISYMREDSPKAIALKNRIESLQKQIDNENRRLISPDEDSLSSTIAGFEPLLVEKEFAEKAYESALTSLEIARADAAKQHRYLATIASPYAPDTATHPKRMMSILTVLLSTMLAFGIGSLLIAAIREHARI